MKSSVKLKPTRWDVIVVTIVVALAVFSGIGYWAQSAQTDGELTAVVSINGTETDRIDLSGPNAISGTTERTYSNNGYTLHVVFTPESVRVASANCPHQDCVHTGAITAAGQSIVCLPSRISIQLVREGSSTNDDVDAVIG